MTRRAARVDGNHAAIRDGLRACGYACFDVHALPGRLDLDVLSRSGIIIPLEIKMPGEPLTEAEEKYLECWPGFVVYSLDQAKEIMQTVDEWRVEK